MQNAFTEKGLNRGCVWEGFGAFFQKKKKKKKKRKVLFFHENCPFWPILNLAQNF